MRGILLAVGLVAVIVTVSIVVTTRPTASDSQSELETGIQAGPARLEPVGDTGLNRVILTERAAERLDIQTLPVAETDIDGEQRLVIPYSAVIYGLNGETWAYINPERLTYVRDPIMVDYIEGELAVLTTGPPVGTQVVTVGVAELYGTDTGVGK